MRLTNKRLIELLFPYLEEAITEDVEMTELDTHGQLFHEEEIYDEKSGRWIYKRWTLDGSQLITEVYIELEGK